jgi:regulatory GntR family protein
MAMSGDSVVPAGDFGGPEGAPGPGGSARPRDVVVAELRRRISQGELRVGEHLPTQAALGAQYDAPRGAVRRALEDLEREGLIRRARQGSSAVVADPRRAQAADSDPRAPRWDADNPSPRSRPAGLELSQRVARAFHSEQVAIDAYCFNGETLASALAAPVVALTAGEEPRPRAVSLRMLLPDPERTLALPQVIDAPADPRPRERLRTVIDHIHGSLRHSLRMLAVRELVPEVTVEARKVAITPTQRVYILNGEEVLVGHYQVTPRRVELARDPMEIYDLLGLDGMLFRHTAVPGDRLTADYVQQTQAWFDSLWSTIARPLDA